MDSSLLNLSFHPFINKQKHNFFLLTSYTTPHNDKQHLFIYHYIEYKIINRLTMITILGLKLSNDFNQIFLGNHYLMNIFINHRTFIKTNPRSSSPTFLRSSIICAFVKVCFATVLLIARPEPWLQLHKRRASFPFSQTRKEGVDIEPLRRPSSLNTPHNTFLMNNYFLY